MPSSPSVAIDFRRASLTLRDILGPIQEEISSWHIVPAELSQALQRYRAAIREMPKAFRQHPLVKKALAEIDSFEKEHLPLRVRQIESLVAELEASPLVQKILRGEAILPNKAVLQWRRKLTHAGLGLTFLYLFVYSGWSTAAIWSIAGPFALFTFSLEWIRHRNPAVNRWVLTVFGPIMREGENEKISAALFYVLSMVIVVLVFPLDVAMLTLLFIAVGDPIAGVVGTYWGRTRITPHVSWEGSAACFVACTGLAALCAGGLFAETLTGWSLVSFSLLGGLSGALSEASFKRLDDNLVMPLLSAPVLWVLMRIFL